MAENSDLLPTYLKRLNLPLTAEDARERAKAGLESARALLDELMTAHAEAIPFENLSAFARQGVDITDDAVRAKLVDGARGGYCHEHACLVRMVLRDLGFAAHPVLARVLVRDAETLGPTTHQATIADVHGRQVLLDPGFGAGTSTLALPLEDGAERQAAHAAFRVVRASEALGDDAGSLTWVVQTHDSKGEGFRNLYGFAAPVDAGVPGATNAYPLQSDLDMSNWYTSTRPGTLFVDHLVLARTMSDGQVYSLFDRRVSKTASPKDGYERSSREMTSAEDLASTLIETFGVQVPKETVDAAWERLG